MSLRLYVDTTLRAGAELALPPGAARHAQVRRVQPGDSLLLFDGAGMDWPAAVLAMGRSEVRVRVGQPLAVHREAPLPVTMALAMPANERMDALVEKATELGVARIQPLHSARSVLRLTGERAERKREHWQAVAVAACEQCGRARVPEVAAVLDLERWLGALGAPDASLPRLLLSLQPDATPLPTLLPAVLSGPLAGLITLSGPEGGFAPEEEAAARRAGFVAAALGPRVLRADTAPLAVLAWLTVQGAAPAPVPAPAPAEAHPKSV